jgi:hypothetical protein
MVTELVISSCKTSEGFYQSQSIYSLTIPTAYECFQNSTETYRDINDRIPMWRGGSARKIIYDGYYNTRFRIGIKLPTVNLTQPERNIYKGPEHRYVLPHRQTYMCRVSL